MNNISLRSILLLLMFVVPSQLGAQYWGERALEKGFEQTDFFFVPANLNPYGIGNFKSTTAGLFNDPLLNLAVNPAQVRLDSVGSGFLYTDFRSARTIADEGPNYVLPYLSLRTTDMAYMPYPWYYLSTRRVLEPVFSGAYIGSPFPETAPEINIGVTYQLLLQDDKYYDVPQDIYRSVLGADYAGNRAAAASSLPIVDRYSGQDNMHQTGHLISAFGSYEIPSLGSIGLKVGRVLFDRSGAFGSSNLWGYPSQSSGTSLWSNLESRSQDYEHWGLAGGAELYVSQSTAIGATAGWLRGRATQTVHNNDSSYYSYSSSPNTSLYVNSGNTGQDWRHDGKTYLLGVNLRTQLSPNRTLRVLYQRMRSTVDIGLSSGVLDTSFSMYMFSYLDTLRTSSSNWFLRDQRSGSGQQVTTTNRVLASVQWQIDDRTSLTLGVQLDWQTIQTNTFESVLADMASVYHSGYDSYDWMYGNGESKDLLWTFNVERTAFQIPIFLNIKASNTIDVLLGLNRSMTHSKVDDMTLALFRFRRSNSNGTITRETDFGERYTQPSEVQSDVRTTFLAGVTARASDHLRVRMLVVPNFLDTFEGTKLADLQWWISLSIFP